MLQRTDHRYYKISGMTCSACAYTVQAALQKHPDVVSAQVDHATATAGLELRMPVPTAVLKRLLDGTKYELLKAGEQAPAPPSSAPVQERSWLATYKPLLLVVAFITGIAVLAASQNGTFYPVEAMRYFMAGFFLAFSFFKLLDLRGFAESYSGYDLLASRWRVYAFLYPFIELGLGVAYLVNAAPFATNLITIVVMAFSLIGVVRVVLNRQRIQCACLGTGFNLPMSTVTVIEDAAMVLMAAGMLAGNGA